MTHLTTLRELAQRMHDGLEVTLLWDPQSNEVSIDVVDERIDTSFSVRVAAHAALDAFEHPYIYAPAWIELQPSAIEETAATEA